MMKRTVTVKEKKYLSEVARLGCCVCKLLGYHTPDVQVHHVRLNHGWGRSGHMATIPLCWEHHQGKTGVHSMGREQFKQLYGKSEIEFMEEVQECLKEFL